MCLLFLILYMVFNDTSSSKDGLIQECETWLFGSDYGAISGNTNLLATFTRLLNRAKDKTQLEILKVDGRQQFHDRNLTTLPMDTADLEANQPDYQLDNAHLKMLGVEVKDTNGDWYALSPIDQQDIRRKGHSYTEFMETAGRPMYYDLIGGSIYLFPKPAADQVTTGVASQSLKVFYQSEVDYFAVDDTTKTPGIPTPLHYVIPLFACQQYAKSNQMAEKVRELDAEIQIAKEEIRQFFSKRNVDDKTRLVARYKSAA